MFYLKDTLIKSHYILVYWVYHKICSQHITGLLYQITFIADFRRFQKKSVYIHQHLLLNICVYKAGIMHEAQHPHNTTTDEQ